MPVKLKRADELHECVKRFKQTQKNAIDLANFTKCVNAMNASAEVGLDHTMFYETLNESHLDELKEAGYVVKLEYLHMNQFWRYRISWDKISPKRSDANLTKN